MDSPKVTINNFLKSNHAPNELKAALFRAAEAAHSEGWTFMETSFQLGSKAKEEGLSADETESVIRRAFSTEKRSQERTEEAPRQAAQPQVQQAAPRMAAPAQAVYLDPRMSFELDTQSLELLQNHRIDPEALTIPWPTADWRKDLAKLIGALFLPGETIAFKVSNTANVTEEKVSVITSQTNEIRKIMKSLDSAEGALISANVSKPEDGAQDETWKFRYAVVDNPKMTLAKQLAYYKALNLPCAALVNTGSNSVQAWVKIAAADADEYNERVEFLFKTLEDQGFKADESNKKPDSMVRMPGVLRSGKQQYLIGLEQGAKDFAEWKEWVEYSLDGKPLIEQASDTVEAPKADKAIIEGKLSAGEFFVFTAPKKSGKSFALLDLALSVCHGKKWFGNGTTEGDVLYVDLQFTRAAFLNRVYNLSSAMGTDPSTPRLGFLNLRGTTMSPLEFAQFVAKRVRGAKKLENHDYKLIVIDPITALLHSPKALRQNSSNPEHTLMQIIDTIISLTGSAVAVATSKGEQQYMVSCADTNIVLDPVEGRPNVFQVNSFTRNSAKAFASECSWRYPQFTF